MGSWKNPHKLRDLNKEIILDIIKKEGTVTRGEITKQSEISHTTVRKILLELLEEGIVKVVGIEKSTGGRRAKKYRLVEESKYLLGVYLKRDSIVYKFTNSYGERIVDGEVSNDIADKVDIIRGIIEKVQEVYDKVERLCIVFSKGEEYIYNEVKSLEERYSFNIVYMWERNAILNEYILTSKNKLPNLMYMDFSNGEIGTSLYINEKIISNENDIMGSFYIKEEKEIDESINEIVDISTKLLNIKMIALGGEGYRLEYLHNIRKEFKEIAIVELNDESLAIEGAINYLVSLDS